MQCEKELVSILQNDAAITAAISGRIHPDPAPQEYPRPFISYWRVSTQRLHSQAGAVQLSRPRIQVNSVADTYAGAKTLGDLVRRALDGHTSGNISVALLDNDGDESPAITGRHYVRQDYIVWCNDETEEDGY
jgi:hypothetical protein